MASPYRARSLSRRVRARGLRAGVAAGAVLAVTAALLGPVSPSQADPVYPSSDDVQAAKSKAERTRAKVNELSDAIVAADRQLDTLRNQAERAAESYNAAQAKLEEAQASADSAKRSSENAQRELATSRVQLGRFAAASYRSGGDIANVGALLTADGPGTLMDRANTISQLSTQREYVLQRVESARVVAELLDQQAQQSLGKVTAATATVRAAKLEAQSAVTAQTDAVRSLDGRKATLRAQLNRLDASAAALADRRAAGIRAAEAARAAAAAKTNGKSIPATAPGGTSIGTAAGGRAAVEFAKSKLGTWYLWGGTGPRYDCSGLTMRAWESAGVQIPRVASWQYAAIQKISTDSLRPGDLLFYGDRSDYQTIHHVGIYVGNGQMIEAPHTGAKVRYASIWRSDLFGAGRP